MKGLFIEDYERFTPHSFHYIACFIRLMRNHELRYIFWGRLNQKTTNMVMQLLSRIVLRSYRRKYGLELNFRNLGGGIRLVHPWDITVNTNATIGKNCTLFKGCTIGAIDKGINCGCPEMGDNVTVYANATICGNIKIGNWVKIAAGSFVNFDVPDNATVIGNPGVIHLKNFEESICNEIER